MGAETHACVSEYAIERATGLKVHRFQTVVGNLIVCALLPLKTAGGRSHTASFSEDGTKIVHVPSRSRATHVYANILKRDTN